MKSLDVGKVDKELSDSSPGGTLSSGEQPPEIYKYFRRSSREDITALPGSRKLDTSPHLRPIAQDNADIPYNFHVHSLSNDSMQNPRSANGKLLRQSSKRAATDAALPKRKSTKRRKDDHVREEEIRAMSAPVGRRPGTYNSGIMRKDSKRMRNGLIRRSSRPDSNVSLPMEESIHSSMSGGSDPFSYHVSRLDVFSPRPHIRSSIHGHSQTGLNDGFEGSRTGSRRRKTTPTKDVLRERKNVDELADDLDSSDIRAALERDQRRKEAKQKKEAERMMRRLARKAEKQRLKEAGGGVSESPPKRKRKDLEKHIGLGLEPAQLTETESPKRKKKDLEKHLGEKVSNTKALPRLQTSSNDQEVIRKETYLGYTKALQLDTQPTPPPSSGPAEQPRPTEPEPLLSTSDLANIHPAYRPQGSALSVTHEPVLITASSSPTRQLRPTSPQQTKATDSPETIEALPPLPASPSKDQSRKGSRRSSRGFMSLFRRGSSRLRSDDSTPSTASFSNVSRESMTRHHLPPNIPAASASATSQQQLPPIARSESQTQDTVAPIARTGSASTNTTTSRQVRDRSGTPVRTMSKFREDLPELPLSPPDSRMTSPVPESEQPAGALALRRGLSPTKRQLSVDPGLPLPSDSGSGSGVASLNNEEKADRGANLMSTSLASVDSEASWLSGRPSKKPSARRSARNSLTSNPTIQKPSTNGSYEDLGMAEDEYFRRLTPEFGDMKASGATRKASSRAMAPTPKIGAGEDDEGEATENEEDFRRSSLQKRDESDLKTGDVGKTPRLVHREPMKSREGLLNDYQAQSSTPRSSHGVIGGYLSPSPEPSNMSEDDAAPPPEIRRFHPTEDVETPDPTSPVTDAGTDTENAPIERAVAPSSPPEQITLARASSIKLKKEAQTPKLLSIPARRASSSTAASDLPTPRKLSGNNTPNLRTSFEQGVRTDEAIES